MKYLPSTILFFLITFAASLNGQCYDLSVIDISLTPDPVPNVELSETATMTFTFCNDEDEVPNDPIGNSSVTICANDLESTGPPTGTYASNFEWEELFGCWYGKIPDGNVTPTGCGTITVEYNVTDNSTEMTPTNAVVINIQPSGILVGNACFDAEDDFVDIITFSVDESTSTVDASADDNLHIFPNPTKDVLFIESDEMYTSDTKIEIFDSNSKLVQISKNVLRAGVKERIHLRELNAGVYLVKLTIDDKLIMKKLFVE